MRRTVSSAANGGRDGDPWMVIDAAHAKKGIDLLIRAFARIGSDDAHGDLAAWVQVERDLLDSVSQLGSGTRVIANGVDTAHVLSGHPELVGLPGAEIDPAAARVA